MTTARLPLSMTDASLAPKTAFVALGTLVLALSA